tara:strand:+ start:203 stop:739 length:537 start_codon:yes stop_codon:yes gene_type:complete
MIMQEIRMTKPIVLIGMMGAGKSSLGARLADRLKLTFVDADVEVEAAAGMSIAEIFEAHGEAAFRDGERRVIARLLKGGPQVLALGGGAFVDSATRAEVLDKAISIWLDVPVDELVQRVKRKPGKRPLLANTDMHTKLTTLMRERGPLYAKAHIRANISGKSHDAAIDRLVDLLRARV